MSDLVHVVCPNCEAVNRLPSARLMDSPTCGGCKQRLFNAKPLVLNQTNFQRHVVNSDIPLLVDFWAPWCSPCQSMAPAFALAAQQLEPQFRLAKVDTEAEQSLATQYAIRSIPTLVIFKNGREIARQAGAMSNADIIRWAQSVAVA